MNTETLDKKRDAQLPVPITIDMSELYRRVRAAQEKPRQLPLPYPDLRISTEPALPDLKLSSLPDLPVGLRLSTPEEPRLARNLRLRPLADIPARISLQPLNNDSYQVQIGGMNGEPLRLEVPRGLDRLINAATLKAIVGASPRDRLLRKAGEQWEVCDDGYPIDLEDRTALFRVGKVQVYS